jgi:Rad3-related DNA helicase
VVATLKKGRVLRGYQRDSILEAIDALRDSNDVAVSLPTGTGKTFVYMPIAVTAADRGLRTCILAATNLIVDQLVRKHSQYFNSKTPPVPVKGIENYQCLITQSSADYAVCTKEQREICSAQNPRCEVIGADEKFENHGFVITNFHKFISKPTKEGFDLVIVDDSHGFENALDNVFETRLHYRSIRAIFEKHNPSADPVSDVAGNLLDLFDDALRTVPPSVSEFGKRLPDDIVKEISQVEHFDELLNQVKLLDKAERDLCYTMIRFIDCCKKSTLNTFYVVKDYYAASDPTDSFLVARKSDEYQDMIVRGLFRNSRIILASATLGDVKVHAKNCTRRAYLDSDIVVVPQTQPDIVKNWFQFLTIVETVDFPVKKDGAIQEGALIVASILQESTGKALLLFKNYRDQKVAEGIIKTNLNKREVAFIDDSFDTETVQNMVEHADIIMATASSRLWEGIDIAGLRLEIIFSLPFIRPPVYMDKNRAWSYVKRKMLIRLQQGIGRMIREENAKGVCVILHKDLEKYKGDRNFSKALKERIRLSTLDKVFADVQRVLEGPK